MRYGEAGQSHLLPFLGAAALFAALTITAHSVVLGLAAVIAGPVPAAQTALSLSRKAVSGAAQEEAASVAEAAPESTGAADRRHRKLSCGASGRRRPARRRGRSD